MVEGIKELRPELQLPSFRELEHFEQAQIPHLNSRSIELERSTRSELSRAGLRKRVRVDDETRRGVKAVIPRRAGKWIADAICIDLVIESQQPIIRSRYTERTSGLQGYDPVELPVAQPTSDRALIGEPTFSLTKGQLPQEIPNESAANVEVRIAHFRGVV